MSKENLIPMNKRSKEEHLRLSAKGGRRKSQAKRIAAKLRELKKKGINNRSDLSKYVATEYDMIDVLILLDKLKRDELTREQKLGLARLMLDWAKLWHGEYGKPGWKDEYFKD